jgi:hypothetical protein
MQETINCPSCQRKLQVPEALIGQDVQCPTCGATFVANLNAPAPRVPPAYNPGAYPLEPQPPPAPRQRKSYRRDDDDYDYEDYDDRPERDVPARRYRRRRDMLPHRGSTVLTLGILSIFLLQVILGPIAWVMANQDLEEMRRGRMDPEGESATSAGRTCAIIGTVIGIVIVVFVFGCCVPLTLMGGLR